MRVLPGRLTLYHFDAWRGGAEDLFAEGSEFLAGDGVAVVEWADRVESSLPRPRLLIELRSIEETTRELRASLVPCSEGAKGRALELAGSLRRAVAELGALSGLEHMSRP
jgi:tRNA A37 threonylcarbamoyladenosine biosynthesis protein TsaE